LLAGAILGLTITANVASQVSPRLRFDIDPQPLKYALRTVTREGGLQLFANANDLRRLRSPALHADATVADALRQILAGTSLQADIEGKAVFIRGRGDAAPASDRSGTDESSGIVVTGTRIRGAPVASPVISISGKEALAEGKSSLAEVVRDIPQNFGGGQNPGIGLAVPGSTDSSGASTINLRGIGGDATLTLLDGHRLAYNVNLQSIDVSSIPFLAVDRIEVVADGASALYGSDAVAGVANVILKHKEDGIEVSARGGLATDGGDRQQQYDVLAGTSWSTGSVLATYEYGHETPIDANERSFSAMRSPGLTLMPLLEHHSALITARQDLLPTVHVSIDGLFNHRSDSAYYALDARGEPMMLGGLLSSKDNSFAIIPTVTIDLPRRWTAAVTASYAQDHARYFTNTFVSGAGVQPLLVCYCNAAKSAEANATGPIFDIPGGPVQIAIGVGLRDNAFQESNIAIDVSQKTYYAFGEVDLPVVSPDQDVRFVRKLNFSAALRYERYPGIGSVATPKLGLIYAPSADVDVKGSWGKSFKAPTMYQRFLAARVGLYTAASLGGTGLPAGATALYVLGGNPDLKPERATTWTATLSAHPKSLPGLRAELSYFDINYRNRVVTPITFSTQALSNPAYQPYVETSPDAASIASLIAGSTFINVANTPYDPSKVVAIVSGNYVNAGRQLVHGVDASANYSIPGDRFGTVTLSGSATYIRSRQKLSALQPYTNLAGTLFNPPHFRARAGGSWSHSAFDITSYVNYIGGVRDERATPTIGVGSMATWDLSGSYTISDGPRFLRNVSLGFAVQNLLNQKPDVIAQPYGVFEASYDATNYSPVGRFISLTVTKRL
jgi:outer membrane receptor protein involved in Fe transport